MLRSDLIRQVKARLDELTSFEEPQELQQIVTSEVKPIDSMIESVLPEAADQAKLLAPLYLIERVSDMAAAVNGNGPFGILPVLTRKAGDEEVGIIKVPQDYLRLHTVRFDVWRRDVNTIIPTGTAEYTMQRNKNTRGRTEKPQIAIANGCFEIYSLPFPEDDGIDHCETFDYISRTDSAETVFEDSIAGLIVLEATRALLKTFNAPANHIKLIEEEEKLWLESH